MSIEKLKALKDVQDEAQIIILPALAAILSANIAAYDDYRNLMDKNVALRLVLLEGKHIPDEYDELKALYDTYEQQQGYIADKVVGAVRALLNMPFGGAKGTIAEGGTDAS